MRKLWRAWLVGWMVSVLVLGMSVPSVGAQNGGQITGQVSHHEPGAGSWMELPREEWQAPPNGEFEKRGNYGQITLRWTCARFWPDRFGKPDIGCHYATVFPRPAPEKPTWMRAEYEWICEPHVPTDVLLNVRAQRAVFFPGDCTFKDPATAGPAAFRMPPEGELPLEPEHARITGRVFSAAVDAYRQGECVYGGFQGVFFHMAGGGVALSLRPHPSLSPEGWLYTEDEQLSEHVAPYWMQQRFESAQVSIDWGEAGVEPTTMELAPTSLASHTGSFALLPIGQHQYPEPGRYTITITGQQTNVFPERSDPRFQEAWQRTYPDQPPPPDHATCTFSYRAEVEVLPGDAPEEGAGRWGYLTNSAAWLLGVGGRSEEFPQPAGATGAPGPAATGAALLADAITEWGRAAQYEQLVAVRNAALDEARRNLPADTFTEVVLVTVCDGVCRAYVHRADEKIAIEPGPRTWELYDGEIVDVPVQLWYDRTAWVGTRSEPLILRGTGHEDPEAVRTRLAAPCPAQACIESVSGAGPYGLEPAPLVPALPPPPPRPAEHQP